MKKALTLGFALIAVALARGETNTLAGKLKMTIAGGSLTPQGTRIHSVSCDLPDFLDGTKPVSVLVVPHPGHRLIGIRASGTNLNLALGPLSHERPVTTRFHPPQGKKITNVAVLVERYRPEKGEQTSFDILFGGERVLQPPRAAPTMEIAAPTPLAKQKIRREANANQLMNPPNFDFPRRKF